MRLEVSVFISNLFDFIPFFLVALFGWNEIKQFLQGLSTSLRHLTLRIPTKETVLHGHRWEEFLTNFSYLKTFNVRFFAPYHIDWTHILNEYRRPFWCEYKKWYFIRVYSALCSLSFYNSNFSFDNNHLPDHTAPNNDWFYSCPIIDFHTCDSTWFSGNDSQASKPLFQPREIHFKNVFNQCQISSLIEFFTQRVDLSCIRKFQSSDSIIVERILLVFQIQMSCLTELDVSFSSNVNVFKQFLQFERIQRIKCSSELLNKSTKDFIRMFPNLEHVIINVQSCNQIFQLIHELTRLQSIQFLRFFESKSITRQELIKRTCPKNHLFTINNSSLHLTCWINHSSTDSQLMEQRSISCYNRIKRCLQCCPFI